MESAAEAMDDDDEEEEVRQRRLQMRQRMRKLVYEGMAQTTGQLEKDDLLRHRGSNKVISKKVSAKSKQDYEGSKLQFWNKSVASAKVLLGVRGFVPCGGPTLLGQRLKAQARQLYFEKVQQLN